ncbi:DUF1643 domain-containing protein [Tabrizicola oligotrophica]|uniref:DUF1643 domain-containing protein n=1 Tax=Tabrizicola oligotrophica TaxID=2710650 RepID=A0A6M0QRC4_9RHOB|nr:DUF1643 domain-containing protein [Tabrizicola oligotrophica]NEY89978.1 DUF1643 domain-containing protein [Tabrizicola oligotrophica]
MIRRTHQKHDATSEAVYSDCTAYRYALTRQWAAGRRLLWVMLNPSTASEQANDPTVERCERRARAMGFGGFRVVNLFAFRATDPRALGRVADPVGPGNDAAVAEAADWADAVVCGWGGHGAMGGRDLAVTALLRRSGKPLSHLGLTRGGQPKHPLYIGYAVQPVAWSA